jgi:hypothetical protein
MKWNGMNRIAAQQGSNRGANHRCPHAARQDRIRRGERTRRAATALGRGCAGFLLVALLSHATAAQDAKTWRFDASLYLLAASMSGDATVHGIPADVDVSFGDLVENLKMGLMGRASASYGPRWSLFTDVVYMSLGASKNSVSADADQWMVQAQIEYHVSPRFGAFFGTRYNRMSMSLNGVGPLGNERSGSGTQDWWDPVFGGTVSEPFAKKFSFDLRADVGGFDVGSDLTWQLEPAVSWHFKEWGSAQVGYRVLHVDYDHGSGIEEFVYDMQIQGPQLGMTVHF